MGILNLPTLSLGRDLFELEKSFAALFPRTRHDELWEAADPNAVKKFNELVRIAYGLSKVPLNNLKQLTGPSVQRGTLMYFIGRTVRILNHQEPGPQPISVCPLISPGRFFNDTRKAGLKNAEADQRGPNLERIDRNFIWVHTSCKGESTDPERLETELCWLDNAIADYFAGKSFFRQTFESDRMGRVRLLQREVHAMRSELGLARRYHPFREYSDGEIEIRYPNSQNEIRAFRSQPIPPRTRAVTEAIDHPRPDKTPPRIVATAPRLTSHALADAAGDISREFGFESLLHLFLPGGG